MKRSFQLLHVAGQERQEWTSSPLGSVSGDIVWVTQMAAEMIQDGQFYRTIIQSQEESKLKIKRKVIISSLATALVVGSLSGLPFRSGGLGDTIGIHSTAHAAEVKVLAAGAGLQSKMSAAFETLTVDEKALVQVARDSLEALTHDPKLVAEVWDQIANNDLSDKPNVNEENLFEMFRVLALAAYGETSHLDELKEGGDLHNFLVDLGAAAGETLTYEDIDTFADALESGVIGSGDVWLVKSRKDLAQLVRNQVLVTFANTNLKLSKAFANLGVQGTDFLTVKNHFAAKTAGYDDANLAMMLGLVRSDLEFVSTKSSDGRELTLALKSRTHGINLPSAFIEWTVSGANLSIGDDGKTVVLASSAGSGLHSGTVTAKINYTGWLGGKQLYSGAVELGTSGGSIVIPPVVTPPTSPIKTPDYNSVISDVNKQLDGYKDKLKNATGSELEQAKAEVAKLVQAAVAQLSVLDLSEAVEVKDGRASLNVSSDSLIDQIRAMKEAYEQIRSDLQEIGAGIEMPELTLTLDLGSTDAAGADVLLLKDVLSEAVSNGVGKVSIKVNGLTATLPIAQFQGDVQFSVTAQPKESAEAKTDKPQASKVYEFGLTVDGEPVTSFDPPIVVRIPLTDTEGLDIELLTLARIDGDTLEIVGGTVEDEALVKARGTFSSYVVIENKVVFNDVANVRNWAGRQIEVIAAKGIVQGKQPGLFYPSDNVTRAEFAKMLILGLELEDPKATASFRDVDRNSWAAPYIAAAEKHGIIKGSGGNQFNPNDSITRAEMATMIARAMKVARGVQDVADIDAALQSFTDADSIHPTLQAGVALAAQEGIVIGSYGKFNPNGRATRAEAAVMVYRLLQ